MLQSLVDTFCELTLIEGLNIVMISVRKCPSPLCPAVRWLRYCTSADTPGFNSPLDWPSNSPDPNPVDYAIWGILQERLNESTTVPLPDPWPRQFVRTTDWRVASFRTEHYWQSSLVNQWRDRLHKCVVPCAQNGKRGTLRTSDLNMLTVLTALETISTCGRG